MTGYILSGLIGAAIVGFICGGWYLLGEWLDTVKFRRWEKKNNITDSIHNSRTDMNTKELITILQDASAVIYMAESWAYSDSKLAELSKARKQLKEAIQWLNDSGVDYEKFVSDVANAIPKREVGWKPSVEQLRVMQEAVMYFGDSWVSRKHQILQSLYEDLMKV